MSLKENILNIKTKILMNYIKKHRLLKGLNKADMMEGLSTNATSERTYSRIENSERPVTLEEAEHFSVKIGKTLSSILEELEKEERIKFFNHVENINRLISNQNWIKAENEYKALILQTYYNKSNSIYTQCILLLEGIFELDYKNRPPHALTIFLRSLSETQSQLINKKNKKIDINHLSQIPLSHMEYRIMMNIAKCEGMIRPSMDGSIELEMAILRSLQLDLVDVEIRKRMQPAVSYNLSESLLTQKRYREVVDLTTSNIFYCLETKSPKMLGGLYCNKAEALYYLANKTEALSCFQKSYDHLIKWNENKKAETVKKYALNKFSFKLN